jgi:hypothetical protein
VSDDEIADLFPPEIRAQMDAAFSAAENAHQRRTAAKTGGRWGKHSAGERIPGYRVVVTGRHRGSKRHTFVLAEDTWDEPDGPYWERVIRTFQYEITPGQKTVGSISEQLPPKVHLAESVDVPATMLAVILDALVSGTRHQINLDDVKKIVSQKGADIARLEALTAEQRRLAAPALYAEILRRCTI